MAGCSADSGETARSATIKHGPTEESLPMTSAPLSLKCAAHAWPRNPLCRLATGRGKSQGGIVAYPTMSNSGATSDCSPRQESRSCDAPRPFGQDPPRPRSIRFIITASAFLALGWQAPLLAEAPAGFVSLFNGRDLTGWKIPAGDNGHWKVIDGVIDYDALSEASSQKH